MAEYDSEAMKDTEYIKRMAEQFSLMPEGDYEESMRSVKDVMELNPDDYRGAQGEYEDLQRLRGSQGEYENLQKLRSAQGDYEALVSKESSPVKEKSFWEKRKESWNQRWQDPETRQGMIDVGVKGIQDLITAPSKTRAAIGDIYTKTRMGQPTRSLDVLAETARPDLYSEFRALEGKKRARADEADRKDKWDRLLEATILEKEAKAKAASKKDE